jgi:hypothetical protein
MDANNETIKKLYIPDISYHLIFRFLSLHQLPQIAQCCREWKRIVTEPSFLKMFPYNNIFQIKTNRDCERISKSQFCHIIRKICFTCHLKSTSYLIHFRQLKSLEIHVNLKKQKTFDIRPVFLALAPTLTELKLKFDTYHSILNLPPSFYYLQEALSYLESLHSFKLDVNCQLFNNISFLSRMKKLQSFSFEKHFYRGGGAEDVFNILCGLPELTRLEFANCSIVSIFNGMKNSKLKHISGVYITQDHHPFDTIPQLQTLNICVLPINVIPTPLGKWIQSLAIDISNVFPEQSFQDIVSFPILKSIRIRYFYVHSNLRVDELIEQLASRLENLDLSAHFHTSSFNSTLISFKSISKCQKLETLSLKNFRVSSETQHALTIPSSTFPMLKKSVIIC